MTTNTTAASGAASLGPIQRFNLRAGIVNPEANGLYVRYVDHVAHIEAARAAAAPAAQEAEPVGYWVSFPDEPELELGHWFSEEPCGEGYLSLPLYAHPPRPQADAGVAPEGCTPADARMLRKANHALAAESFELQAALRGIVDQAGKALARFDIAPQADAGAVPTWTSEMIDKMNKLAAELPDFGAAPQAPATPVTPNCPRCLGSGEDPEGYYDQSKGDAGHTHDGPCRDCSGTGEAPAAPTAAAEVTYAPLPKPYSAAAALGLDDLYTGDDMRAYADAHRGAPAPAAGAAVDENEALDLLDALFAAWEDGTPCYDEPESAGSFLGNAFRLDDDTFNRCCELLDRRRSRHTPASTAPAAGAAPSQHITQPYTVAEIRERVASGDYSAELMLQHALLHLGAGAAPTDAEIADVSLEYVRVEPLSDFDYVAFARAVLARWGAAAPAQEAEDAAQDFDEWFYRQRVSAESDVMPSDEERMRAAWNAAIDAARARQEGQA